MSRWEFMRQLEKLLSDISPNEREEALQYYNDYFNDAGMENEQEVIKALGSPEQVAKIVKDGLGDGGNQGVFTENGFLNSAVRQNELMKKEAASGGMPGLRRREKLSKRTAAPLVRIQIPLGTDIRRAAMIPGRVMTRLVNQIREAERRRKRRRIYRCGRLC